MDGCDIIKAPMLQKRKQQVDSVQLVQSVRSRLWAQEKKENVVQRITHNQWRTTQSTLQNKDKTLKKRVFFFLCECVNIKEITAKVKTKPWQKDSKRNIFWFNFV